MHPDQADLTKVRLLRCSIFVRPARVHGQYRGLSPTGSSVEVPRKECLHFAICLGSRAGAVLSGSEEVVRSERALPQIREEDADRDLRQIIGLLRAPT
jgi:hypothetical protein